MKKWWVFGYLAIVIAALCLIGTKTMKIDPFFHFHAPDTEHYSYVLDNERSQNDGIARNFEYEGLITGSSMTENFKASEATELFGAEFIKIPYSGGTFNEINGVLSMAALHNPNLKYIIRSLDMDYFFDPVDRWRTDLGVYPTYLYDEDRFNDLSYIFNRDVIFSRIYPMEKERKQPDFLPGITSFDEYANWSAEYKYGYHAIYPNGMNIKDPMDPLPLTEEEEELLRANIRQNVTALCGQYPKITFYLFITPYSAIWWHGKRAEGTLDKWVDAEKIIIEEMLQYDNIKLFSFNCLFDITTDLNHYKDHRHYGEWINSLLLLYMRDEKGLLTQENYMSYLDEERDFYKNWDYTELTRQKDYEQDLYAAALMDQEIYGQEPYLIDFEKDETIELQNAEVLPDQHEGQSGLVCTGRLGRVSRDEVTVSEYMWKERYVGAKIAIPDASPYRYLAFYGRKIQDHGQLTVRMYNEAGEDVVALDVNYHDLDTEWHQYVIDITGAQGPCTLILNGGYIDNTGVGRSQYVFSEVVLY